MPGGPVAGDGSSLFERRSSVGQEGSPGASPSPAMSALDVILSSYRTMARAGPIESRTLPASTDNSDEEISHDSDRGQIADDLRVSRSLLEADAPAVGNPRVWGFPTSVLDDQIPENCCVQGESRAACRRNMQAAG